MLIRAEGTRIELRSPDPSAKPDRTLALCLRAGLEGRKKKIQPMDSVNGNIYSMTEQERNELGILHLPSSLLEALHEMEKDPFIKEVLGEHIFNKYLEAKKDEWHRYRQQVTDWEVQEYLYKF